MDYYINIILRLRLIKINYYVILLMRSSNKSLNFEAPKFFHPSHGNLAYARNWTFDIKFFSNFLVLLNFER